ncbi:hypothetical protein PR048_027134 [Dryococelus australis]|uniref:Uncharacterized protein n=1 Tax=Dryococelus australis TaxID=614101 RepID=A0ABQ9GEL2_9NEOP|nr:hypothetical protein PR048_027134 [Dryococelus australis]
MQQRRNEGAGETGDPRVNPSRFPHAKIRKCTQGGFVESKTVDATFTRCRVLRHVSLTATDSEPAPRRAECDLWASISRRRLIVPTTATVEFPPGVVKFPIQPCVGPARVESWWRARSTGHVTVLAIGRHGLEKATYATPTPGFLMLGSPFTCCVNSLSYQPSDNHLLRSPIHNRATVAEWLACTPPTKENRVQSPEGLPDFRKWESCRTIPLANGLFFLRISRFPRPFIPAPLHTHLNYPRRLSRPRSYSNYTPRFRVSLPGTVTFTPGQQKGRVYGPVDLRYWIEQNNFVIQQTAYLYLPSIKHSRPSAIVPRFLSVRIVQDDATGRWVFSGISSFPPPVHSGASPYSLESPSSPSQDLVVKSRPNLFTQNVIRSVKIDKRPYSVFKYSSTRHLTTPKYDRSPLTKANRVQSPCRVTRGFWQVRIMPDDSTVRRVFSGIVPHPPPHQPSQTPRIPALLHSKRSSTAAPKHLSAFNSVRSSEAVRSWRLRAIHYGLPAAGLVRNETCSGRRVRVVVAKLRVVLATGGPIFPATSFSSTTALVLKVNDTSWRTVAQLSLSTLTAGNQCTDDIGIYVHKTVESSLQPVIRDTGVMSGKIWETEDRMAGAGIESMSYPEPVAAAEVGLRGVALLITSQNAYLYLSATQGATGRREDFRGSALFSQSHAVNRRELDMPLLKQ